jgi:hypothetical protein
MKALVGTEELMSLRPIAKRAKFFIWSGLCEGLAMPNLKRTQKPPSHERPGVDRYEAARRRTGLTTNGRVTRMES